jgi:hypothetical protein
MTSSAVANSVSGMVRPSALAVLRLMTSSTFSDAKSGTQGPKIGLFVRALHVAMVGWGLAIGGQHGSANAPMPNDGPQFFHGHRSRQQSPQTCPIHKDCSSLPLLRPGTHLGAQGRPFGAKGIRYWITSSAVANSVSGMVRPSALAVLRLMASSNLVGACTGRSAGLVPLRMRST